MIDLISFIDGILSFLLSFDSGPLSLFGVFSYSFLVALVLPMPGEFVLAIPIDLGISPAVTTALIVGVSSLGKAIGGLVALQVGGQVVQFGFIERLRRRLPSIPPLLEQESRVIRGLHRYGYIGMALALAVPLMPDTAVIYGFSIAKMNPIKFTLAAFTGTLFRLLTVLGFVDIVTSIV